MSREKEIRKNHKKNLPMHKKHWGVHCSVCLLLSTIDALRDENESIKRLGELIQELLVTEKVINNQSISGAELYMHLEDYIKYLRAENAAMREAIEPIKEIVQLWNDGIIGWTVFSADLPELFNRVVNLAEAGRKERR